MDTNLRKTNKKTIEAYHDFSDELKHAARYLLWLPEARSLKSEKGRFLTYFTLPGKWAYDIFFFEQEKIVEKRVRGFPGVRFCENNDVYYSTAKRLLGDTIGIKKNFEELVLNKRPEFSEFWDGFPYDIYNLDFCGTCFPDKQPPFSNTFKALTKIIKRHYKQEHFPFLIFLTMKAFSPETSKEAKKELMQNIEDNRQDRDFTDIINNIIPNTKLFAERDFVDFIILSVPKIICHIAQREKRSVHVQHRAKYERDNGRYHIAKFVFRFDCQISETLRIKSPEYITNIKNIMRVDNVLSIDTSSITDVIKKSHDWLLKYKEDVNKETAKY